MVYEHWTLSKENGEYVVYASNIPKPVRNIGFRPDKLGDEPFRVDTEQYHRTKFKYKVDLRYYTGFFKLVFPMPIPPHEKHIYESQLTDGVKIQDISKLVPMGEYVLLNTEPTDIVNIPIDTTTNQIPTPQPIYNPPIPIQQTQVTNQPITPSQINTVVTGKGKKIKVKTFKDDKALLKFINDGKISKDDIQQFGLTLYWWQQ